MDYLLVMMTLPATIPADDLARALIERRIMAGANIIPDVVTLYADDSGLHETRETIFLCRTLPEQIAAMRAFVETRTGEHEFEISALPVAAGNPLYTAWIRSMLPRP
jgi:periplasmic divalent cation tolerance protein